MTASTAPVRTAVPSVGGVEVGRDLRPLAKAALLVGLVATLISMAGSWIPSLWGDEAATVMSASRPWSSLFAMLAHVDAVHGLSYIGWHVWIDIAGSSPFAVRAPAAFAIGATAAGVVWLTGRFATLRLGVVAGLVAAVLPRLTLIGAEARGYAFTALVATALCVVVGEILLRAAPSWRWWVGYTVILITGTYVFIYVGLLAVAVGVVLAVIGSARSQWRRWLIASAIALAVVVPLFALAYSQRAQVAFLARRDSLNIDSLGVEMWFGAAGFAVVAWTLIVIAVVGAVVARIRRDVPDGERAVHTLTVLSLGWMLVPAGVLVASSPIVSGFAPRYAAFSAPAAAILIALGVRRLSTRRWVAALALAALLATAAPVWAGQRLPYADNDSDWSDISAVIRENAVPGDAIAFDESVRLSRRPRLAMTTDPASFTAVEDVTLDVPYAAGTDWHDNAITIDEAAALGRLSGVERIWIVQYAIGARSNTWGLASLQNLGFTPTDRIAGHRSVIYLYER